MRVIRWLPPATLAVGLSTAIVLFAAPDPTELFNEGCRTGNPYLTTTRQWLGSLDSEFADMAAIVAVHDSRDDFSRFRYPDNAEQITIAKVRDIGAVFGLAYDWRRTTLYAASYYNASFSYGPKGPGYVYAADLAAMKLTSGFALPAGPDYHDFHPGRTGTMPEHMAAKVSFGDIDVDEAANYLFIVNLFDRRIYRFSLPNLTPIDSFPIGGLAAPWAGNARPFGIDVHAGWVYHGVVDSREDDQLPGSLAAHVYRSRFDGSEMNEVLAFDLDYLADPPWEPWSDQIVYNVVTLLRRQPLIVDIVFAHNEDMIIGLSSRTQAMFAFPYNVGDIVRARKISDLQWVADPSIEAFEDDLDVPPDIMVAESNYGSLARLADGRSVATTGAFPSIGIKWYDSEEGVIRGPVDGKEIVASDISGLGDLEALCAAPAPPSRTPPPPPSVTPTTTDTASSTPKPTSSPTLVPTLTTTPQLRPAYLPVLDRLTCRDGKTEADIAIILDVSTSMARITADGRSKLEVVIDTTRTFAERLDSITGAVQVGIVGFNSQAWTERGLSSNLSGLSDALWRLPSRLAEGTRLDLGLQAGEALLFSQPGARVGVRKVAILMTDGLPNLVPTAEDGRQDTTVLRAADHLRTSGALVFSIGFGNPGDFDPVLLTGIAGNSDRFFQTPDSEDLQQIFSGIATQIPCQ